MNAWLRWVVEVDLLAALAVSATQAWAQGASNMEDWLGLPKEEVSADLRAQIQAQEAAVARNRKDAEAHYRLARLYLAVRTVEGRQRATWAIEEAIRLKPKSAAFRLTYARILRAQWMPSRALDAAREACRLDSTSAEAHYLAGRLEQEEMLTHWDKLAAWDEPGQDSTGAGGLRVGDPIPNDPKRKVMAIVRPITDRLPETVATTERLFAEKDAARAVEHFEKAIALNPDYRPGYDRLGLVHVEMGRPEGLARLMSDFLKRHPDDKDAHLFLALGHQLCGRQDAAFGEYQRALSLMGEEEAGVMQSQDLLYVKRERKALEKATEGQREGYEGQFWASRDPLFLTAYNEREMEHYGRVAYANLRFSLPEDGVPGWKTDQGRAYIRFGRPLSWVRVGRVWGGGTAMGDPMSAEHSGMARPDRIIEPPSTDPAIIVWKRPERMAIIPPAGPPVEPDKQVWHYEDFDLAFWSGDGSDRWRLGPESRRISQSEPDRYVDPYEKVRYDLPVQVVGFKSQEGDQVDLEISYALPKERLRWWREEDIYRVDLERGLFLFSEGWQPLVKKIDNPRAFREAWQDSIKGRYLLPTSLSFQVSPGPYHLALEVKDRGTGSIGTYRLGMDLKGFSDGLDVSGILLASEVEPVREDPKGRDDFAIVPNPLRVYERSEMVAIYFEVYGLKQDPNGQSHYRTEVAVGRAKGGRAKRGAGGMQDAITKSYEVRGGASREPRYLKIDARQLEPGAYRLVLSVTDLLAGRSVSKTKEFRIVGGVAHGDR